MATGPARSKRISDRSGNGSSGRLREPGVEQDCARGAALVSATLKKEVDRLDDDLALVFEVAEARAEEVGPEDTHTGRHQDEGFAVDAAYSFGAQEARRALSIIGTLHPRTK